jgi:hypothetical protein
MSSTHRIARYSEPLGPTMTGRRRLSSSEDSSGFRGALQEMMPRPAATVLSSSSRGAIDRASASPDAAAQIKKPGPLSGVSSSSETPMTLSEREAYNLAMYRKAFGHPAPTDPNQLDTTSPIPKALTGGVTSDMFTPADQATYQFFGKVYYQNPLYMPTQKGIDHALQQLSKYIPGQLSSASELASPVGGAHSIELIVDGKPTGQALGLLLDYASRNGWAAASEFYEKCKV